jgi:hypothetical protein
MEEEGGAARRFFQTTQFNSSTPTINAKHMPLFHQTQSQQIFLTTSAGQAQAPAAPSTHTHKPATTKRRQHTTPITHVELEEAGGPTRARLCRSSRQGISALLLALSLALLSAACSFFQPIFFFNHFNLQPTFSAGSSTSMIFITYQKPYRLHIETREADSLRTAGKISPACKITSFFSFFRPETSPIQRVHDRGGGRHRKSSGCEKQGRTLWTGRSFFFRVFLFFPGTRSLHLERASCFGEAGAGGAREAIAFESVY